MLVPRRIAAPRRGKYANRKTVVDGITFASKREAARYSDLRLLERAGEITGLRLQVPYPIHVNGRVLFRYVADFVYQERGATVVEDAKGFRTDIYRLKRKAMSLEYGITIRET